jgi:gluconokinase
MDAYIIGVDIGTSSTKVLAVRQDGKVVAHHQQDYSTQQPQPGYSEQDPEEILKAVVCGIRSVAGILKQAPEAISFSCAMHSVIAVDKDHQALTPLIIWADNRSQSIADRVRQSPEGSKLYEATGVPVHPMSPMCKITWWKEEAPEIFQAAAYFIGIKEFIFYRFFGKYITDHAIASATGLFNIHTLEWNEPSLQLAGIDASKLPEAVPCATVITGLSAKCATEMDIPETTKFVAGGSDGCLAQLGSNALDAGHASLTIGTSGAVRMTINKPVTDAQGRLFTYVLKPDNFIIGGASNNGGVLVQWFIDAFVQAVADRKIPVESALQKAFEIPPGSDGLLCLPYFHGERAPVWDGHTKGTFIGVLPHHNAWHFMRAILEGMAYGLLSITEALKETAGDIKKISVSGGFTASEEWVQMMADIFQCEMHLHKESDASAMGAVLIGFEAVKIKPAFKDVQPVKIFSPSATLAETYRPAFVVYKKLYGALKDIFREL